MNNIYKLLTLTITLIFVQLSENTFGQVVVTPSSGGTSICVGGNSVTLGALTLAETANGDIANGPQTYTLNVPANFQFDITAVLTYAGTTAQITGMATPVFTTTTLTITFNVASTGSQIDQLVVNGIKIKAITAPAFGSIISSTNSLSVGNTINHATLFSVASPIVSLACSDPTNTICIDQAVSFNSYGASTYQFFKNGISQGPPSATSVLNYGPNTLANNDQFYVIGTSGGCSSQSSPTINLTVNSKPAVPTLSSPTSFNYITSDPPILMVGNPGGGIFSGVGVSGNYFDPAVAGTGSWGVTYTVTNAQGCSNSDVVATFNISNPVSKITNLQTSYCIANTNNAISLSAAGLATIPAGYAFYDFQVQNLSFCFFPPCPPTPPRYSIPSVPASNSGTLNPQNVYTLTGNSGYKIIHVRARRILAPNDIVDATAEYFILNQPDVITFGTIPSTFSCQNAPNLALTASPSGGIFSSTPFAGYITESPPSSGNYVLNFGAGSNPTHFYPNAMTLNYTYTNPSTGCNSSATSTFYVDQQPAMVTVTPSTAKICYGEDPGVMTVTGVTSSPQHRITWYKDVTLLNPASPVQFAPPFTFDPGPLYDTITFYVVQDYYCQSVPRAVTINVNDPALISAGIDKSTCPSKPASLTGVKGGSAFVFNTPVTWSKPGSADGNFNATNILSPIYTPGVSDNAVGSVKLKITTNDPDGVGGCPAVSDSMILTINPLPIVNTIFMDSIYCRNQGVDNIFGTHANAPTEIISGPGITGSPGFGFNFAPSIAGLGTKIIKCVYTDVNGCVDSTTKNVNVYPEPVPSFTISSLCSGRDTTFFTNTSSISNTPFNTPITTWNWTFDNVVPDTSQNSKYLFTNHGVHNVKLKATTGKQCTVTKDSTFIMGPHPKADFKWSKVCQNDSVAFVDLSTISVNPPGPSIAQRKWDFDVANTSDPLIVVAGLNKKFKYPSPGNYNAKLILTSNIGCLDSVTYSLYILPKYAPTASNPYFIAFKDSSGLWATEGKNNSWEYGITNPLFKNFIQPIPTNVWVTNKDTTYNVNEKSSLNSPCFNFAGLSKPMIAVKFRTATLDQIAGMVLEYSIDGAVWQKVGISGDGSNWYNTLGIAGGPGNPTFNAINEGWSGFDSTWRIAKIGLSTMTGLDKLRFRFAFGSPSDSLIDRFAGVAIDSVWIGNKNKMLLIEHFTNTNKNANLPATNNTTPAIYAADTTICGLRDSRKKDVAAVFYHTSFPAPDIFNEFYGSGPSSRVLYYGVSNAPRTILDGNYYNGNIYKGGTPDARIDIKDIDARSLETSIFKLDMTTLFNPGVALVNTQITYTNYNIHSNPVILHTVITEDDSSGAIKYGSIARQMLPDAAGNYISKIWNLNDVLTFSSTWNHSLPNTAKLGVVSFIQDAATKEIYQAAYIRGSGDYDVNVPTGIEPPTDEFNVRMFPNPATDDVFFLFGKSLRTASSWVVYDNIGRIIEQGTCNAGKEGFSINTSNYTGGIYYIKLQGENGVTAHKELVVIH